MNEFEFTFARSSGAGGQNVNKVNSKAILRWPIAASHTLPYAVKQRFVQKYRRRITANGDLILVSQKYRDQSRNVSDCIKKLEAMIATVMAPPVVRRPTKPTAASRQRRINTKRTATVKKQSRRRPSIEE